MVSSSSSYLGSLQDHDSLTRSRTLVPSYCSDDSTSLLIPLLQRAHSLLLACGAHSTLAEALVALFTRRKVDVPGAVDAAGGPLKSWTNQLGREKDFALQLEFACAWADSTARATARSAANILRLDATEEPNATAEKNDCCGGDEWGQ